MRKGSRSLFNSQHSTLKKAGDAVLEPHGRQDKNQKRDLENRLPDFAAAAISLSESLLDKRPGATEEMRDRPQRDRWVLKVEN